MQTDALIRSLAEELTVSRAFAVTVVAGFAVAALVFALALGFRPDLLQAGVVAGWGSLAGRKLLR